MGLSYLKIVTKLSQKLPLHNSGAKLQKKNEICKRNRKKMQLEVKFLA